MTILTAIILGIIGGIAGFLPVSATGHVTLFANIFGAEGEIDLLFMIAIHLGTMISVILVYLKPVSKCLRELVGLFADIFSNAKVLFSGGKEKTYKKLVTNTYRKLDAMIITAMIPSVIIGILVAALSETLVGNLLGSGIGMLVSALLLLVASFSTDLYKGPHEAKYVDVVLIGAFQGFSGFPGISRTAMALSSSYLSSFKGKLAIMFTFILSIPTIIGAYVFEAIRAKSFVSQVGFSRTFLAMLFAAVVGYFVLSFVRKFLAQKYSRYFAAYCLLVGLVSIIIYIV